MSNFVKGDVVQLKSGGPVMTVALVGENGRTGGAEAFCKWFDDAQVLRELSFPVEMLDKIE